MTLSSTTGAWWPPSSACFFRELRNGAWEVIAERVFDPDQVYEPGPD